MLLKRVHESAGADFSELKAL